jgi:hypothetical protein
LANDLPMQGRMALTRAYMASIGAGMSLAAAAVAGLFLFSAVVAFTGWPGFDPDDDVPAVTLSQSLPSASGAADAAGTGPLAAAAAAAGAATPIVLGGGGAGATGTGDVAGDGPTARIPATRRDGAAPSPGAAAPPATGAAAPQTSSQPQPGSPASPVEQITSNVGRTIRDTGSSAGAVTDQVAPGTGEPVRQTTGQVAETVEGVGQAAGAVTRGDVSGATERAGQTVGALLGG